jgi:probable F420-dependent oxidoreductase
MKLGLMISGMVPHVIPDLGDLPDLARDLEAAGADEFVIGEHLLQSPDMGHPGAGNPKTHWDFGRPFLDPYVALAAISATTERADLTTGAVLGAARPAIVLAKTVASLDVLSGGRASLGVAPGWWAPELEAAGVRLDERLAKVDELISVCRLLWGEQPVSFSGRWTRFENMWSYPRPIRGAKTPIWFGGRPSKSTMTRVVCACDGWMASQAASFDEIATAVELLNDACATYDRSIDDFGIRATVLPTIGGDDNGLEVTLERSVTYARRLLSIGVTNVCLPLARLVSSRDEASYFVRSFRESITA